MIDFVPNFDNIFKELNEYKCICVPPFFLEIRETPKGRGVFTNNKIIEYSVIEIAPIIKMPREQIFGQKNPTILEDYVFNWGDDGADSPEVAIALGYGSLYNHSSKKPNADFRYDYSGNRILFFSLCPIQPDEEILINYGAEVLSFKEQ